MANLLTGLRLLLAVPCALAFAQADFISPSLLLLLLFAAIVTDYLDGAVARLAGTASPAGILFDHLTDCVFVTAGLGGAAFAGSVTPVLPVVIVIAFVQYVMDSHFYYRDNQLRASLIGRANGILYFAPLCMIAAGRSLWLPIEYPVVEDAAAGLAWVLVASTVVSILARAMPMLSK